MNSHLSERASQSGGLSHAQPRVLFGVTGGIAAYKAVTAVRRLRQWGANVVVVPTHAALDMVGKTTWEAISGNPVHVDIPEEAHAVVHVNTGAQADLFVVAPGTAHTIAKLAHGLADNLLTASALVATCPRLIAPAMHTQMWEHPATQENIATLVSHGWSLIGPVNGQLTGSDSGIGRMEEPENIAHEAITMLEKLGFNAAGTPENTDLTWVISAGGTHEAIDPVRYIGNHSSGIMGVHIANAARACGHNVTLVAANITSTVLEKCAPGVTIVPVTSARDVHETMDHYAHAANVIVMAAAISDYRVVESATKIKRGGELTLRLEPNPDILHDLATNRRHPGQCVVGFAAETGDNTTSYLDYGKQKARRKGADLLVINKVGGGDGFGDVATTVTIVTSNATEEGSFSGTKIQVAQKIVETIERLSHNGTQKEERL